MHYEHSSVITTHDSITDSLLNRLHTIFWFALIPVGGKHSWDIFVDTDPAGSGRTQEQLKGWHHHWFPYRLTVNTEDRRRGSGLFQHTIPSQA